MNSIREHFAESATNSELLRRTIATIVTGVARSSIIIAPGWEKISGSITYNSSTAFYGLSVFPLSSPLLRRLWSCFEARLSRELRDGATGSVQTIMRNACLCPRRGSS
eukprot:gb/GECG01001071.1/.p1 GENE.gb/GECG01001071.1/~~gb/GECG01001071.1/.p1  ORF type:complete len:108 (+),score=4.77 gb/GECG01001071.1/:1-324(+)